MPSAGVTVDTETWMYANANRAARILDHGGGSADKQGNNNFMTEVGASDKLFERYPLVVKTMSKTSNLEPVKATCPPSTCPRRSGTCCRLLPLRESKPNEPLQYMFATYMPDHREVMARYVDVLIEQDVLFNGRKIQAIPILDRIGWEGAITTHYMSPEGKYLGSEATVKEPVAGQEPRITRITILPTDADTLNRLWEKPDLTPPQRQPDDNAAATTQPAPACAPNRGPIAPPVPPTCSASASASSNAAKTCNLGPVPADKIHGSASFRAAIAEAARTLPSYHVVTGGQNLLTVPARRLRRGGLLGL